MMFTDPKSYENPPKMCQKRAKTAGLSENQPKKLFLQNSPTEMGKIQEMYCHICQDIISSLPQTALLRVKILLRNGVHWSMTRMPEPGFFALPYRAVNDTNAVWSMTRMQIVGCISHSVHSCH